MLITSPAIAAPDAQDAARAIWVANAARHIATSGKWAYVEHLGQVANVHEQPEHAPYTNAALALRERDRADQLSRIPSRNGDGFRVPEVERANHSTRP